MMVEKQRWVLSFDYDERVKSSRRSRAGVKCRCASAGAFFSYGQAIPSPAAKCSAHLKRGNAYLRLRYTAGGDKEGSLWITEKNRAAWLKSVWKFLILKNSICYL